MEGPVAFDVLVARSLGRLDDLVERVACRPERIRLQIL
jgi:hypothetical protein